MEQGMPTVRPGEQIKDYVLESVLGRGGFGTVWRARHVDLPDHVVAIKLLNPEQARDNAFVQMLKSESLIVDKLKHPGIVEFKTFLYRDEPRAVGVVMEVLEGHDLQTSLRQPNDLDWVLEIAEQALSALSYAHRQGVVHRDIKPRNLFWCADGRLKVLDFGIARVIEQVSAPEEAQRLIGSYAYMSPERFQGQSPPSADVYALGLVLWELLAGARACPRGGMPLQREWHSRRGATPIQQVRAEVPDALAAWLARMVSSDPAVRFPDAEGALLALRALQAPPPPPTEESTPLPVPQPSGGLLANAPVLAIAVLFLGLIGIFGGAGLWMLAQSGRSVGVREGGAVQPPVLPSVEHGEIVLRLCGSSTVGAHLAPALAENFLTEQGYTDLGTEQDAADPQLRRVSGTAPGGQRQTVLIASGGTRTALGKSAAECHILMASKGFDQMKEAASILPALEEEIVALDAIALLASPDLRGERLTMSQLGEALTENRWPRGDLAITVCARNPESGTHEFVHDLLFPGGDVTTPYRYENYDEIVRCIQTHPPAIGYVAYAAVRGGLPAGVRSIDIAERDTDGHTLDEMSILTETYPLTRRLRLYLWSELSPTHPARTFLESARGRGGQAVVNRYYLGLERLPIDTVRAEDVQARALEPSVERVGLNIYFDAGSSEPDARGRRDIPRLARLLAAEADVRGPCTVHLLGFEDNDPGRSQLSRADTIRDLLHAQLNNRTDITLSPRELGRQLFVGDNGHDLRKKKNRRVEVWLSCHRTDG